MKKKIIFTSIFICFVLILFKFMNIGTFTYKDKDLAISLPKLTFIDKKEPIDEDRNALTFKSYYSKNLLEKNSEKKFSKYIRTSCRQSILYYDKKSKVTIENYEINPSLFLNTLTIQYYKGQYTPEQCNKIVDVSKIEYTYYHLDENQKELLNPKFKYLNKNGSLYDVYSDCKECLMIKNGGGHFDYITTMLEASYISMDTLIEFLEYQVKETLATKEEFYDGEEILYKNKDFSLLKCNTEDGNLDIYMSDSLDTSKRIC